MTDLATLVLAVDSTQVKTGAAALDGLTAAGAKAEAATATLGSTTNTAAAQATKMAAEAQIAARAVNSFSMSSNNARIVGLELTHVTRSLTEQLAMGVSPARAFTSEIGRLATAAQYAGGVGGLARAVASLLAPFAAVAAAAGVLATAFIGVKQAADSTDMQAYIDTLGLTDKQMKKLTDTTVTWGDLAKATFQVLAENAGTSAGAITGFFSSAFHSIGEFGKFSISILLAGFGALVKGAADIVLRLPDIIGGAFVAAANMALAAVEKMARLGVLGINKLTDTINGSLIGQAIEKIFGVQLPHLAEVSLGRVGKQFVSLGDAAKAIGGDIAGTMHDIFNRTEATFDAISARAVKLRQADLAAQAAAILADDAAGKAARGHLARAKAVKEEADAIDKLRQQLEHLMALPAAIDKDLLNATAPSRLDAPDLEDVLKRFGDPPDFGEQILNQLRAVADQAQVTAQAMSNAFGPVGDVFGGLIANIANYSVAQQQIADQVASGAKTQATAETELAALRVHTTAQALSGLKGLFKEHSTGYKVMSAVEKAYAAFQAVQTVIAMVRDATHTASSVANSATRAAADEAAGASKIFGQLGVWAFPVVAAMVAVLATFGLRKGGGGGGIAPRTAEQAQAAQGAGTVLGDTTAKSESIANSLEIMAKNSTKGLDYSNEMVRALRGIRSGIEQLATSIAREFQAGGSFDTAGLGLGTKSSGIQGLFGSKTTTSLYDQGLVLNSTDLASAIANGISGSTYQIIEKVKKSSGFLGIGGGTKTSYSTTYGSLDPGLQQQVGLILGSLRDSVIQAAKVLGLDVGAALNTFQVEIGKISFEGLKGDEITDALQAVFSKVADQMAGFAVAGLEQFQKAGEGLFETLSRLAKDYLTLDAALKSIGKTFGSVGAASIAMREKLIDLAGGLDQFVDQVNYFYDHFLSDAQKTAFLQSQVDATFKTLGIAAPKSITAFANLVNGINLSTDAGQQMFAALMAVAPAFYEVKTAAEQAAAAAAKAAAEALKQKRDDLVQAYKRESAALQQTADKFHKFAADLRAFRDSLFATSGGQGGYNAALVRLMKQAGLATGGDEGALGGGLQDASQKFLDVATQNARSLQDVERARALVARYLDQAIGGAEGQATIAERQLKTLHDQVDKLVDIDEHILSVAEAIRALGGEAGAGGASNPRTPRAPKPIQSPAERDKALHDRLDKLHHAIEAVAVNTGKTARIFTNADRGGSLAIVTDSDQPLATTVTP